MTTSFSVWALPALCGVGTAIVAGWMAVRRRARAGAPALLVLAVAVGWWCLMQVVSIHLVTVEGRLLAAKAQYLGVCAVPFAWLWFATSYTGWTRRIPTWGWALVLLPEIVTLTLAWTNEWHGLIWRRLELVRGDGFLGQHIEYGAWFQLHVYYAYGLLILGTGVLSFHLAQVPHHRARLAVALAAPLFPWAANLVYLSGLLPRGAVDLTPMGLALAGVVMAWALLRQDLLEIPAVARSRILDTLRDGVVVVGPAGRIVDLNRAAARVLAQRPGEELPEPFRHALRTSGGGVAAATIADRIYELDAGRAGRAMAGGGAVLVIRDVTERHRMDRELVRVSDELRAANEALEHLANTDHLLGVANRRRFMDQLGAELSRARRFDRSVSVALLDLDHFKSINDTLGHAAGDRVLQRVAAALTGSVREVDLVGRIGGDELAVLLPETDADGASIAARRMLEQVARLVHEPRDLEQGVTVSVGIAVAATGAATADELLHLADVALYRAKAAGRNRVAVEVMGEATAG